MFYLLNTYTPAIYRVDYLIGGPAVSAIPDIRVDVSLAGLERSVEKITKEYPNPKHQFQTISEFNTLTDEVDQVCKKEGIDSIIMGTTGASGAKEIFLGSNTIHLIRKATVPVLAIPEGFSFQKLNTILFPTDYQEGYNKEDLKVLIEMIKKFNATLHVIHAVEEILTDTQLENKKLLKTLFGDLPVVFQDITNEYLPNSIHAYIEQNNIDLVAMMNRKYTFLQRLLFRQNIDSVGYHCAVPFLVLPHISGN